MIPESALKIEGFFRDEYYRLLGEVSTTKILTYIKVKDADKIEIG